MSHYDKIAASAPINKNAAVSTARGSEWRPTVALQDWYDDPLPLRPLDAGHRRNPEFVDFTGISVGRLTVLGLVDKGETSENTPASWLCRCKCGCYTTRKSKSLRIGIAGGNSFVGMCGRCYYQNKLASGWSPEPKKRVKA